MNERIKQLLVQAYDEAVPETWTTLSSLQQGRVYEKFAELIVRECADWIDGSPTTDAGQLILTKSFIISNLKEHFGVEE